MNGDTVTLTLAAEPGSLLLFAVGAATVHTVTASGDRQQVSFVLPDGVHQVQVDATDAAGNTSTATQFRVTIDTVPPDPPMVKVTVGETAGASTGIEIEGEARSDFYVSLAGTLERSARGSLGNSGHTLEWRLPNGDYALTATLTDATGNASESSTTPFTVSLPPPGPPSVQIRSPEGANPVTVSLAGGDGAESAIVTLTGQEGTTEEVVVEFEEEASTDLEFDLDDGIYVVRVVSLDFQGLASRPTEVSGIAVDTTPPALDFKIASEALGEGRLEYYFEAEEGAIVRIGSDTPEVTAEYVATGTRQDHAVELPAGEYQLTVTAVDAFGNATAEEFSAVVQAPFGAGEWAVLAGTLGLFGALALGLVLSVKRLIGRRRPSTALPDSP